MRKKAHTFRRYISDRNEIRLLKSLLFANATDQASAKADQSVCKKHYRKNAWPRIGTGLDGNSPPKTTNDNDALIPAP
jgi:hypothetical protein